MQHQLMPFHQLQCIEGKTVHHVQHVQGGRGGGGEGGRGEGGRGGGGEGGGGRGGGGGGEGEGGRDRKTSTKC